MIYFISDTHFGHANIIKYTNRPFSSTEEMNEVMIERWNSVVKDGDAVYHLGDFAYGTSITLDFMYEIWNRLRGAKILIRGNHDNVHGFGEVFGGNRFYSEIRSPKFIALMHYPILTWDQKHHGSLHLHGHTHSHILQDPECPARINVCVEAINYTPISLDEILALKL